MLTNYIEQLTTTKTNIYIEKQYFKVVCLLLKFLSINSLRYIYFNYLQNIINFVRFINTKTNIKASIINNSFI